MTHSLSQVKLEYHGGTQVPQPGTCAVKPIKSATRSHGGAMTLGVPSISFSEHLPFATLLNSFVFLRWNATIDPTRSARLEFLEGPAGRGTTEGPQKRRQCHQFTIPYFTFSNVFQKKQIRQHHPQGEGNFSLSHSSSLPPPPPPPDGLEAKQDFWSMSGSFICRHLFVNQEK